MTTTICRNSLGSSLPVLMLLGLCLGAASCAGQTQVVDGPAPQNETEQLYFDAMEHLAGASYLEAEQEFHKVLKLPSYLKVTALARLRLGDAQYAQHKYDEAIETFLSFIQRHDTNENVPYALFMVAKAHYQLAPDDVFFLPPVEELDLGPAQQARSHLERFVRQFPRSRFVTEALQLRDKCLDLQFAHHAYVIQFYQKREKWLPLVFRMHLAMQQFPTRARNLANFQILANAYTQLGWRTRAVELLTVVATRFPAESAAAKAQIAALQAASAADKAKGLPGDMPAELPPTANYKPEAVLESEDS